MVFLKGPHDLLYICMQPCTLSSLALATVVQCALTQWRCRAHALPTWFSTTTSITQWSVHNSSQLSLEVTVSEWTSLDANVLSTF